MMALIALATRLGAEAHHQDLRWLWVIPAVFGAFLLLLFVVALVETRLTRPYVPAEPGEEHWLPEYVRFRSEEIRQAGFALGGVVRHAKVSQNNILGTIWFSPERDILVLTSAGTVARMPAKHTWLFTPLSDERMAVTTDQNDEGDCSGLYLTRRLKDGDFPQLLDLHRRRLNKLGMGRLRAFRQPSPLDALLAIYSFRVERMVQSGRARYLDPEHARWKYTWVGAATICANFFVQLGAALTQFWRYRQ